VVFAIINARDGLQVKQDDLKEAVQQFIEELVSGKEFIADSKGRMIAQLESQMVELNEELLRILGLLHQGVYMDPESVPADVVSQLKTICDRVQQLKVGLVDRQMSENCKSARHSCAVEGPSQICFTCKGWKAKGKRMAASICFPCGVFFWGGGLSVLAGIDSDMKEETGGTPLLCRHMQQHIKATRSTWGCR
jgi:hypothetical protein